jgi:hypothetical protein
MQPSRSRRTPLAVAKNVVPITGGYGPQPSLAATSGYTALGLRPRGAISMIDPGGNAQNYVGTETKLYRLAGDYAGTEDVTRSSGAYNCSDRHRWEFARLGRTMIAVNPNDDPQYIDTQTGLLFNRLEGAATDAPAGSVGVAPRAYHAGIVGDHLVLGNVIDGFFGHVPDSIWWPQIANPFHWPDIGSDAAVAAQSDRQPLEGNGGWVQRILGGAEVGIIFQERAIWRMDYRGGDVIFELTRVEPNRGLLAPGLAAAVGRYVLFCSEDGWYGFDYTSSVPVGKEVVDRHFLNDLDHDYLDRCSMEPDPEAHRIYCLYPGSGHTDGVPNKYVCFDWSLNRWTHGEIDAEILVHQSYPPGNTLDTGSDPDDVDAVGEPSFDTRQAVSGGGKLGAYDTSFFLGQFNGAALAATLETGSLEIDLGYSTLVTLGRPVIEGGSITVEAAALRKAQSPVAWGPPYALDLDGDVAMRANGRYHRLRINIAAGGFTDAVGVDLLTYVRSGHR